VNIRKQNSNVGQRINAERAAYGFRNG
jgi:hypothetical protein